MLLGLIQGLTEFLPVSSSGHLVVAQHLFGLTEPQLLLDVMLHLGTLLAVFVVLRHDLWGILLGLRQAVTGVQDGETSYAHYRRLCWLVGIATIPTVIIGLSIRGFAETIFGSPIFVGIAFLVTGTVLWISRLARQATKQIPQISIKDGLLIGLIQGLAITPGISRSGTTISMALLIGIDRGLAARFSFLMAIPAILGAVVLELPHATAAPADVWLAILTGMAVAAVSGYIALKILMRMVLAGSFSSFAYYCWSIGLITLIGVWYW